MLAHMWRCVGSYVEKCWLIGGNVSAHWVRCGDSLKDVGADCWRCAFLWRCSG